MADMAAEDDKSKFLSDSPIESVDEDEFRHKEYVDTLEEMVHNADPAWNIGVFGEWGSGKTSIIRMLYSRLQDAEREYVCVEFDAWKHAEESIRTDLLLNLDQAIGEKTGQTDKKNNPAVLGEEQITDELYDVEEAAERVRDDRSAWEVLKHFLHEEKYVAGAIVGIGLISLVASILISPQVGAGFLTVVLVPLLLYMAKQLSNATDTLRRKFVYPRREWSGAYEQLFEDIIDETEADRVIISIDNLDRCESETVYDVLVSLKTFLEQDECVYIIPCDDEALQSHIESIDERGEYFESQKHGREFLRKFFQTHLRIPQFIPEDIERYAEKMNEDLSEPFESDVIDIVTKAYVKNPRRIKQSLNQLTTLRILAEQIEDEEEDYLASGTLTDNLDFLAKVMVLQEDFPDFYSELQDDVRLLEDVNQYFRGDLADKDLERRIEVLLDREERNSSGGESRLETFLRATLPCMVDNPQPFLRLGEPAFRRDLSDADTFLQNLRTRQEEDIRNRLESIREEGRSLYPYLRAIDRRLDDYISESRYTPLFSTINTLLTVFPEFEEENQSRVAEVLGEYLVLDSVQKYLSDFDPEEFFPVLLKIPDENRHEVFVRYAEEVNQDDSLRESVLKEFVEHAAIVPRAASNRLCTTLLSLDDGFDRSVEMLAETEESKALANSELLKEAADITIWQTTPNEIQRTEPYMRLDSQAKPRGRKHFVKRLLELQSQVDDNQLNQYDDEIHKYLSRLEGQVARETGDQLFDTLRNRVSSRNGQLHKLVQVALQFYDSYSAEKKEDCKEWVAGFFSSWSEGSIRQIVNQVEESDVPIFSDADAVDSICSQIPDRIGNNDFIKGTLIPVIPEEHDQRLHELVESLSEKNDSEKNLLAAEILAEYPSRFGPVRETVLERCRTQLKRTNNVNQKKTYLRAEFAVYDLLERAEKEDMITRLSSLLSEDRQHHQAFKQLYTEFEERFEDERKTILARNIREQILAELGGNIQHNQLFPLVDVFGDLSEEGAVDKEDGEKVVERLSNNFKGSNLNDRQVATLIEKISKLGNLYGQEEQVFTRLENLINSNSNTHIHSSSQELLEALSQTGTVEEQRIEELAKKLKA